MTEDRWRRLQSLFESGLSIPAGDRSRWLMEACPSDPELRSRLRALLEADDEPLPLFRSTSAELARAVAALPEGGLVGWEVGPYTLVRQIGRGGMGAVYLGERPDVGITAAIKVVWGGARGWARPEHVRRFMQERRLLARLEHPFIARLLDGGITENGIHWSAMEFVAGEPITAYCQRRDLDIATRLVLFNRVCEGVGFAHRNLIVHRDLKPTNILVSGEGAEASPKLLDFGIAKLLRHDDAPGLPVTRTDGVAMTPEYAAPEQVLGDPVTTATDIYALGVVLYELLTGQRPYRLDRASPADTIRVITGTQPPRPSEAVRRQGEERLARELAGDLDTVVLKALEKEPKRRYESVAHLSADLGRFLEGRPIQARRPTAGERTLKFVRRNRTAVVAATLVLLALVGGLGVALQQVAVTERAKVRAERTLVASEQVRSFLFDLFQASRPSVGRTSPQTLNELLEQGIRRVSRLEGQPLVQARVLEEIGQVYFQRGDFDRADQVFRRVLGIRTRALGPADLGVARSLAQLGDAALRQSRFDRAERLYERALALHREGGSVDGPDYAGTLAGLASVRTYRGEYDAALRLYRRILEIRTEAFGPDHPAVVESLRLVAVTLRRQGRNPEATAYYRRALDAQRRTNGPGSVEAAWAMIHLADQHFNHNHDPGAAVPLTEEAVGILRARLGDRDPQLIHGLNIMAALREAQGDLEAADSILRESLAIAGQAFGERSWRYGIKLTSLGALLARRGMFDEAEALHRRALAIADSTFHAAHRVTLAARVGLAELHLMRGQADPAERIFRDVLRLRSTTEGAASMMVAGDLERLASALVAQDDLDEAQRLLERALAIYGARTSDGHRAVRRTLASLIDIHEARNRNAEAERYRSRLARADDAA